MIRKEVITNTITQENEVYITSDGVEYDDLKWAEHHEYYYCKLNKRQLISDREVVLDFTTHDEIRDYIDEYHYSDVILKFDIDSLELPNTYVFVERLIPEKDNGEDDIWFREQAEVSVYKLDEYKMKLIKEIEEFK